MRILLFGDGAWAANSARRLLQSGHEILGVVVRRQPSDSTLVDTARALRLPVLQPDRVNTPEFVSAVHSLTADLSLSISYNQILRPAMLETPRLGFVNFHAGKLPYYRGRNVINWAIINGESEIGITAHFIDEGIDTGDIILQRTLPISWTDTYGDLLERVVEHFPSLVVDTVECLASGNFERRPQAHLPGTYFPGRKPGDEWLDWSDCSRNIHNKIRAISRPGPGARTQFGERGVVVWRGYYDPSWPAYKATPGLVLECRREGVVVKTGDSTLLVQEVQLEGGSPEVPNWQVGTRLGINLLAAFRSALARLEVVEKQNRVNVEVEHGSD